MLNLLKVEYEEALLRDVQTQVIVARVNRLRDRRYVVTLLVGPEAGSTTIASSITQATKDVSGYISLHRSSIGKLNPREDDRQNAPGSDNIH